MRRCLSLLWIGTLLLLGSCNSMGRLAYNNLDTLLRYEIGRSVTLDAPQKRALDAAFHPLWQWHRQTELPRYAAQLRQLAQQAESGTLDAAALSAHSAWVDERLLALLQQASPPLAGWLPGWSDAQVRRYVQNQHEQIDEAFAEYRDETVAERRRRYTDEFNDTLEDWLGESLPAQRAAYAAHLDAAEARGALHPSRDGVKAREGVQRLAAALDTRGQPGLEQRLRDVFQPPDPAWRQDRQARRQRSLALLATLAATLDTDQRQHFARRLRHYAALCEQLARTPPKPAP